MAISYTISRDVAANDLSAAERAFLLRLVKACTKRFRGNAMDTAAGASATQADAPSDETWQEMTTESLSS